MEMSEKGKKLLAEWEGVRLQVYKDVAGKETIGVGHLLTQDELASGEILIRGEPIRYDNGLTEQQVMDLLDQDLERFGEAVNNSVNVQLTQNQFDDLVSFTFNLGVNAFKTSTLLRLLNEGKYEEVPNQLRLWVHSGGQRVQGSVNRREKEIQLWSGQI